MKASLSFEKVSINYLKNDHNITAASINLFIRDTLNVGMQRYQFLKNFMLKAGKKEFYSQPLSQGLSDLSGYLFNRMMTVDSAENATYFTSLILSSYNEYYGGIFDHPSQAYSEKYIKVDGHVISYEIGKLKALA